MPAKNSLKIYVPEGFYHIYNRGVEKRAIFLDKQDYQIFLCYLRSYLLPREKLIEEIKQKKSLTIIEQAGRIVEVSKLKNFFNKITLFCFSLMPNHYHLLLRQKEKDDLEVFMRSLNTRYSKYFNKKYQRVGHLFQGRYKGILVTKDDYFLHLSRYIHMNAKETLIKGKALVDYSWSSYPFYVNRIQTLWIDTNRILSYFNDIKKLGFSSYQTFVEGYKEKLEEETNFYNKLMLE